MTLAELAQRTPVDGEEWVGAISVQLSALRESATRNGKAFLDVEIADGTATEKFKVWADAPHRDECDDFQAGDFVSLEAVFRRNHFGLNIDRARLLPLSADEKAELLAGTPERRAFLDAEYQAIAGAVAAIADPRLRLLCQTFLDQHGEKFRRAAAARDYHHARRGGLVEHVAQMIRGAQALRTVYPHLHWDLVVAGVLFHDCGKLWENDYAGDGFVMPFTLRGELLGHISVGIEVANALWRALAERDEFKLPATPPAEQVRLHLLHLIASHHGQREFGAPVTPRTAEAWALHQLDNLDARIEMIRSAYAEKPQIAPGIHERRMPLEGHPVTALGAYLPPPVESDSETA
jgi:3'-5' exoribonuclease